MRLAWRLSACCSQRASGQLRRRCCYLLLLLPVACVCVRTKLPQSTFSPKLSLAFVVSSPSSPLSRAISSSQTTPSRTVCRQLRRALACPICIEGNNLRPLKSCAHCVRARLPVARRLTRTKALWHERNSLDTTEGPRGRRRRHWRAHSYSARSLAGFLPLDGLPVARLANGRRAHHPLVTLSDARGHCFTQGSSSCVSFSKKKRNKVNS